MENENICEFCGQVLLDGKDCNCPSATEEREIRQKIKSAKAAIERIFTDDGIAPPSAEAINYMKWCVDLIARGFINKSSILLPGAVKANISIKNGVIKVERVETIKDSVEAH